MHRFIIDEGGLEIETKLQIFLELWQKKIYGRRDLPKLSIKACNLEVKLSVATHDLVEFAIVSKKGLGVLYHCTQTVLTAVIKKY